MKKFIIFLMITVSIVSGFFIELWTGNFVNSSNLIEFTTNSNNDLYLLNVKDSKYILSKVNSKGVIKVKKEIPQPQNSNKCEYQQLDIDSSGNIYLLSNERKYEEQSGNNVEKGIINEKVLMFDSDCNYIKEVTSVDFSNEDTLSELPYIYKLQVNDDSINLICRKKNDFEVLTVNPLENEKPQSIQHFQITPKTQVPDSEEWLTDMAVSSQGKIAYGTRYGEMFVMDAEKNFQDITSFLGENICPLGFSTDDADNLYFTEVNSENYYKLSINNMTLDLIYNKNSVINKDKNIKFDNITYATCVKEGQYCAVSKDVDNLRYFTFGDTEKIISNVKDSIFSYRILMVALSSAVVFAAFLGICFLYLKCRKRMNLSQKIIFIFSPIYIASMLTLTIIAFRFASSNYFNYLSNNQKSSAKIVIDYIDGDLFESVNPFSGYLSDSYLKLKNQVNTGVTKSNEKIKQSNEYTFAYTVKNNKIYVLINEGKDDFYNIKGRQLNFARLDSVAIPIEYIMDEDESDKYYEIWGNLSNKKEINNIYVLKSNQAEWITSFEAINNSKGQAVGFIGVSVDKEKSYNKIHTQIIYAVIITVSIIVVFLIVFFALLLNWLFKPFKEINKCMNNVSQGRWNTNLSIHSKDEFYDISVAFNAMLEKVRQFVSEITTLSREYERFVPSKLINFLGKKNVFEISETDRKKIKASIIYVTFSTVNNNRLNNNLEESYFSMMDETSDTVFKVIEGNNGIVEWFDGMGVMAYFPNGSLDAISASMQFKESFKNNMFEKNMKIMLSKGNIVIGIIGNRSKRNVSVVSNEVLQMNYVSSRIGNMPLNYFALEPIIDTIEGDFAYNYRLVGEVEIKVTLETVKIYEFIDSETSYGKNLYLLTKDLFESAVNDYINGNLIKARKAFANVLKINEKDEIAMYYLVRCDKLQGIKDKNWKGYIN